MRLCSLNAHLPLVVGGVGAAVQPRRRLDRRYLCGVELWVGGGEVGAADVLGEEPR